MEIFISDGKYTIILNGNKFFDCFFWIILLFYAEARAEAILGRRPFSGGRQGGLGSNPREA
jgi:hypothetical protein